MGSEQGGSGLPSTAAKNLLLANSGSLGDQHEM
jgi:hypothetical protein